MLAVIPVAVCVRRKEVHQLKRDHSEGVKSFFARIKGKANSCGYAVRCPYGCNRDVDYTSQQIKDVGLADQEIQSDVLGWQDLDTKSVSKTVTFVESKEMARNALSHSSSSTNAMNSSYQKMKKSNLENEGKDKKMGKCPICSKDYHLFKFFESTKRWNEKPLQTCFDCKPMRNRDSREKKYSADGEAGALFTAMGAISNSTDKILSNKRLHSTSIVHILQALLTSHLVRRVDGEGFC